MFAFLSKANSPGKMTRAKAIAAEAKASQKRVRDAAAVEQEEAAAAKKRTADRCRRELTTAELELRDVAIDELELGLMQLGLEGELDDDELGSGVGHRFWTHQWEKTLKYCVTANIRSMKTIFGEPNPHCDPILVSAQHSISGEQLGAAAEDTPQGLPAKKKGGRVNDTELTWATHRAPAIFMVLHPRIWGSLPDKLRYEKAAKMLGLGITAVYNWFQEPGPKHKSVVPQWWDMVHDMTWGKLKKYVSSRVTGPFDGVVSDEDTVHEQLLQYKQYKGERTVLSCYNTTLSASTKGNLARRNEGIVVQKAPAKKTALKAQPLGYPEQHKFVKDIIDERWAQGDPISREELYDELAQKYKSGQFYEMKLNPLVLNQQAKLAKWVTKTLKRHNFSERKRSVSQKIPDNWYELAIETSDEILQFMLESGMEVLVTADQTFMKFYHETDTVIPPTGVKRVGGNKQTDEKAGCTLMVATDLTNSKLLKPFLVLNGKTGATLDQEYAFWPGSTLENTATVAFQKKHWFDVPITLRWLEWLKQQPPAGTKVGLIWDHAPAHDSQEVKAFLEANEYWLFIKLIPGGMTSIMQVCDVACNAQLKRFIRAWYRTWRNKEVERRRGLGETGHLKLKLPRDDFIKAIQIIFKQFNESEKTERTVEKAHTKLGQNIFDVEASKKALRLYLDELRNSQPYSNEQARERLQDTLTRNQTQETIMDPGDSMTGTLEI